MAPTHHVARKSDRCKGSTAGADVADESSTWQIAAAVCEFDPWILVKADLIRFWDTINCQYII
jgi:hypothetical protein